MLRHDSVLQELHCPALVTGFINKDNYGRTMPLFGIRVFFVQGRSAFVLFRTRANVLMGL